MAAGSTASYVDEKNYAYEAARDALTDHLAKSDTEGAMVSMVAPGLYRVHWPLASEPMVTIIVPTRDELQVLTACIASILQRTEYRNYEILVVDNQSPRAEARRVGTE